MNNVLSYKAFLMKKYNIDAETANLQVGIMEYISKNDDKSRLIEDMIAYRSEYHKWENKTYKTVEQLDDESIVDACDTYAKYLTLVLPETLYVNSAIIAWLQKWGYGAYVALSYTAQEVMVKLGDKKNGNPDVPLTLAKKYVDERESVSEVKSVLIGTNAIDRAVHSLAGGNAKTTFENVATNNGTLNGVPYQIIKTAILDGSFKPSSKKETQDATSIINSVSTGIPLFITAKSGKRVMVPVDGDLDALRFDCWRLLPRPATQEAYLSKLGMKLNVDYSDTNEKKLFLDFFKGLNTKEDVDKALKKTQGIKNFFSSSWLDGSFLKNPMHLLFLSHCHFRYVGKAPQYPSWVYEVKSDQFIAPNMIAGFLLLTPKFLKIMTLCNLSVKKKNFTDDLARMTIIYGCSSIQSQLSYGLSVFNEEIQIDLNIVISEKKKAVIEQINLMGGDAPIDENIYKDDLNLNFNNVQQDQDFINKNVEGLKQVMALDNQNKYREKNDITKGKVPLPPPNKYDDGPSDWESAFGNNNNLPPESFTSNDPNKNSQIHIPYSSDKLVTTDTKNNSNVMQSGNVSELPKKNSNFPVTDKPLNIGNNKFVNRPRGPPPNTNVKSYVPPKDDYDEYDSSWLQSDANVDASKDYYNDD